MDRRVGDGEVIRGRFIEARDAVLTISDGDRTYEIHEPTTVLWAGDWDGEGPPPPGLLAYVMAEMTLALGGPEQAD